MISVQYIFRDNGRRKMNNFVSSNKTSGYERVILNDCNAFRLCKNYRLKIYSAGKSLFIFFYNGYMHVRQLLGIDF